ncbi:hypothetical protein VPH35_079128 [Triticum aestivum]
MEHHHRHHAVVLMKLSLNTRLDRSSRDGNIDVSSELIHMDENTTSLQYVDRDFNSTPITPMPIQMQYVQALPSENDGDIKYYFAAHWTEDKDKGYYGLSAVMDVYGFNLNHGQMTGGAIWIQNLKAIWTKISIQLSLVWPSRFKDSHTHFFTVWTKDSHRSTGCVNLDCPGFQLVKGSPISPGDIITLVSGINGKRHSITIKESSRGDWWLSCGIDRNPRPVGYFPASLFDNLRPCSNISTKTTIPPPMGRGTFASNSNKAASIHDIWLIHKDGISTLISNDAPTKVTDDKLYSASPIGRAKFFYGGPEGKS